MKDGMGRWGTIGLVAAAVVCCAAPALVVVSAGAIAAAAGGLVRMWPFTLAGLGIMAWGTWRIVNVARCRRRAAPTSGAIGEDLTRCP